jgi:hypothetical protein
MSELLNTIPTFQSAALIGNLTKKKKKKKLIPSAVETIVGAGLISEEANFLHGI